MLSIFEPETLRSRLEYGYGSQSNLDLQTNLTVAGDLEIGDLHFRVARLTPILDIPQQTHGRGWKKGQDNDPLIGSTELF